MTTYRFHETAREAARCADGRFGEQPKTDPGDLALGPAGNFGDTCITGPTPERFTAAAADALSDRYFTDPDNSYVVLERIGLIQAKRLADVIARLYPHATEVQLVRRGAAAEYLQVDRIVPVGTFGTQHTDNPGFQAMDDEVCNLSRFCDGFRDRCIGKPPFNADLFTFRVADMQAITADDLDTIEE